jgi:hypothetical protein
MVVAAGEDIAITTNLPLDMAITKNIAVTISQRILNTVSILNNLAAMGILDHKLQLKEK